MKKTILCSSVLLITFAFLCISQAAETANNGGLVVKSGGIVYYREYRADDFEKNALWGNYSHVPETSKKIVCLNGALKKTFADDGEGSIYIANDRLYLMKRLKSGGEDYQIYSVDIDGKNKKEHGAGTIRAYDEESGLIVFTRSSNGKTGLYTLSSGGTIKKLSDIREFISLDGGVVYYTEPTEDEARARNGEVVLGSVGINGTEKKTLVKTKADSSALFYDLTQITCLQVLGDYIYFAFGGYSGTAYLYQGGKIARVGKDGKGYKILAGENYSAGDNFYIMRTSTEYRLYYEDYDISKVGYVSLKTGNNYESTFELYKKNEPFVDGDGVSIYADDSGKKTVLVTAQDWKNSGLEGDYNAYDETYISVTNAEIVDGWVYYKLESGKHYPSGDIGWRYCYERTGSQFWRKNMEGGTPELLFSY